jgi:hypothetical protein
MALHTHDAALGWRIAGHLRGWRRRNQRGHWMHCCTLKSAVLDGSRTAEWARHPDHPNSSMHSSRGIARSRPRVLIGRAVQGGNTCSRADITGGPVFWSWRVGHKTCVLKRAIGIRETFRSCGRVVLGRTVVSVVGSVYTVADSFFDISHRNVRRQQAADHQALDVAHGVPPPRAAPPLLRRVVLNCSTLCRQLPLRQQLWGWGPGRGHTASLATCMRLPGIRYFFMGLRE